MNDLVVRLSGSLVLSGEAARGSRLTSEFYAGGRLPTTSTSARSEGTRGGPIRRLH
jgi:hypothetical protein